MSAVSRLSVARIILWLILALTGSAQAATDLPVWWDQAQKTAAREGYGLISLQEMDRLYDSGTAPLILDVRPHYEYQDGHLPDAVNLEFHLGDRMELKPDKAAALKKILGPDKSRPVIIYCRSYS